MPYISITDGRSARYHSLSPPTIGGSPVEGFYTDNFSSCNIVVLYTSKNNVTKISMTHADQSTTNEDIGNEIDWVGSDCACYVIRKKEAVGSENRRNTALGGLRYKEIFCPDDKSSAISVDFQKNKSAVAEDSDKRIEFYNFLKLPQIIVHPREYFFNATYKLNLQFKNCDKDKNIKLKNTKLIFNVSRWAELSEHDKNLLPSAAELMQWCDDNDIASIKFPEASGAIRNGFLKKDMNFSKLFLADDHMRTVYAFQLLTKNDCNRMLIETQEASSSRHPPDIYMACHHQKSADRILDEVPGEAKSSQPVQDEIICDANPSHEEQNNTGNQKSDVAECKLPDNACKNTSNKDDFDSSKNDEKVASGSEEFQPHRTESVTILSENEQPTQSATSPSKNDTPAASLLTKSMSNILSKPENSPTSDSYALT